MNCCYKIVLKFYCDIIFWIKLSIMRMLVSQTSWYNETLLLSCQERGAKWLDFQSKFAHRSMIVGILKLKFVLLFIVLCCNSPCFLSDGQRISVMRCSQKFRQLFFKTWYCSFWNRDCAAALIIVEKSWAVSSVYPQWNPLKN